MRAKERRRGEESKEKGKGEERTEAGRGEVERRRECTGKERGEEVQRGQYSV